VIGQTITITAPSQAQPKRKMTVFFSPAPRPPGAHNGCTRAAAVEQPVGTQKQYDAASDEIRFSLYQWAGSPADSVPLCEISLAALVAA